MNRPTRRFYSQNPIGKPHELAPNHPAILESRTLFPSRVKFTHKNRVLKSGEHSRKLGSRVVKGRWSGMAIFSLTLEERKTCPSSCLRWRDCYGNHMPWPERYMPGVHLEAMLEHDLIRLQKKHPKGFVVRLHVLGDFYSSDYVVQWGAWLKRFPALHVFGYTARDPYNDEIGLALLCLHHVQPERWWIRFSDRDGQTWLSTGDSGIICPAQTGATDCCGTCGLCWTVKKPIRFLMH